MKTYTQMKSIQNFNKKALCGALVAAGMTMASTGVYAAEDTGIMVTSATLANSCSISGSTLAFTDGGNDIATLNGRDAITGSTSDLTVACTSGVGVPTIYATALRNMIGPNSAELPFNLSLTSGAAGDDLPSASGAAVPIGPTETASADGTAKPLTIYGSIPSASFDGKPAGTYTADITLTVVYPA